MEKCTRMKSLQCRTRGEKLILNASFISNRGAKEEFGRETATQTPTCKTKGNKTDNNPGREAHSGTKDQEDLLKTRGITRGVEKAWKQVNKMTLMT